MKIFILWASFALFVTNALAQHAGSIRGTIVVNEKPAEGATVTLLRAKDSATVKLSASNKGGQFGFEQITDGRYLVSVTAVGHQKAFSTVIDLSPQQQSIELPLIRLVPLNKDLAGVTISAKRPLIEQRIDRTVVNVDASITNVGTSALEVLEKSPGISVDKDGNISLKGKEGVMVMVDGRPTQLGGADLANLLRNMNSAQLDQIEIMTNPPARYDASGTSGVINIKTKKNITAGINGSASVAYSQGRYPKTAEAFNFNYREGKVNLFTNLSHNYQKRFSNMKIDRNIYNSNTGSIDNIFNQEADRLSKSHSYSAKVGVDFFATKKTTFGAVVNINTRNMTSANTNVTRILNAAKNLQGVTEAMVNDKGGWNSLSANLNFRTLLPKGKELTSDIDFVKHASDNSLFMVNAYTDAAGNPSKEADTLQGWLPQNIKVYSARLDYLQPVNKTTRFEAGIKSSIVNTDNDANYDSIQNGRLVHDVNRSNHFAYEENINAVYVNLSTSLSKKWSVQAGLRLENTNAKGSQLTTGQTFNRHYTQLFPTVYFQYKANEKNNFGINFGRRVSRPSYQSLNPFIRFIDRYTFSQGNPDLVPSTSNNIELTHIWKNLITTTLNYTSVTDIIQEIIQQRGQEAYNMPGNVSSQKQFGIVVNANTPINKWWTSSMNINVYHDNYKGVISGAPVDLAATSFVITGTQQFKLGKTLSAEVNARYRSSWLEGVIRTNPILFIGAGISQQVLKNAGTIRLTARDIFWTQRLKGKIQYGNVDVALSQVNESQIITLGFTYTFSKGKKIAPVKRTAGSAGEEQNRIGQ